MALRQTDPVPWNLLTRRAMKIMQRLKSTRWLAAGLGLGLLFSACAPSESEYVGEDRSGLTEEIDARSPVMPEVDDDGAMTDTEAAE
jgi:hypothetical protein